MKTRNLVATTAVAALIAGGLFIYKAHAETARAGLGQRGPAIQRAIKELGLSDEQVGKIKSELRSEKDTLTTLLKKLHDTRKDLRETVNTPDVKEADVRAASAKVAAVEADLAVERAKLSGKIAPVLTPEQIGKIKEFQEKVDDFVIHALKTVGEKLEQ
jgi:Spy/CpxP family protein refolding chaperone